MASRNFKTCIIIRFGILCVIFSVLLNIFCIKCVMRSALIMGHMIVNIWKLWHSGLTVFIGCVRFRLTLWSLFVLLQSSLPEQQLAALIKSQDMKALVTSGFMGRLAGFRRPSSFKPLLVLFGLFFFQQFSGVYTTLFHSVELFQVICFYIYFEKLWLRSKSHITTDESSSLMSYNGMQFGKYRIYGGSWLYPTLKGCHIIFNP